MHTFLTRQDGTHAVGMWLKNDVTGYTAFTTFCTVCSFRVALRLVNFLNGGSGDDKVAAYFADHANTGGSNGET
jgi:hypothetical protein